MRPKQWYHWTDKENSTHAIQKKDTQNREAGKEIEKTKNQTSKTHYFLTFENDTETQYYLYKKVKPKLETIFYEYVYKDLGTESKRHYLTKEDLDRVLQNLDSYEKNEIIKIEITPPKYKTKESKNRMNATGFIDFIKKSGGNQSAKDFVDFAIERKMKLKELKNKRQETRRQIEKIENEMTEYESKINERIKVIEKRFFIFYTRFLKMAKIEGNDSLFNFFLNEMTKIAETEKRREKSVENQQKYRDGIREKKIKEGKPVRKRGRPPKNKTENR